MWWTRSSRSRRPRSRPAPRRKILVPTTHKFPTGCRRRLLPGRRRQKICPPDSTNTLRNRSRRSQPAGRRAPRRPRRKHFRPTRTGCPLRPPRRLAPRSILRHHKPPAPRGRPPLTHPVSRRPRSCRRELLARPPLRLRVCLPRGVPRLPRRRRERRRQRADPPRRWRTRPLPRPTGSGSLATGRPLRTRPALAVRVRVRFPPRAVRRRNQCRLAPRPRLS